MLVSKLLKMLVSKRWAAICGTVPMAALRTIVSVVMLMFVVALYIHHWNVFRVYDTAVQYLLRTGPRPALVCCSDGEFVIHSNTSYDLPPHHGIPSLRTEDITTTTIDTPSLSLHCSLHDFGREMTHRCAKRSPAEAPVRSIPQPSAAVVHEAARTKHVTGNVTTVVLRRHGSIRNHIYHEMAEAMAVFRLLRLAGSAGPPSERWPPAQLVLVDGEAPWLPATENIFHAITQREILYIHNELPSENTKFRRPIHDQSHGLAGGEGRIITSYKVAPPGEMLAVVEPAGHWCGLRWGLYQDSNTNPDIAVWVNEFSDWVMVADGLKRAHSPILQAVHEPHPSAGSLATGTAGCEHALASVLPVAAAVQLCRAQAATPQRLLHKWHHAPLIPTPSTVSAHRRVLVVVQVLRSRNATRSILNEDEVVEGLQRYMTDAVKEHGEIDSILFVHGHVEVLSLTAQKAMFSKAGLVLAAHGAVLTHLTHSPFGAGVVEAVPENFDFCALFGNLARFRDVHHALHRYPSGSKQPTWDSLMSAFGNDIVTLKNPAWQADVGQYMVDVRQMMGHVLHTAEERARHADSRSLA